MKLIRKIFLPLVLLPLLLLLTSLAFTDEGMYPLSEIHKLNLKAKGFKIDAKQLYNPQGVSLVDAIVQVGGCTGSFVSNEGLILTNHHCAFGAVQAASTAERDYITNGFLASTRSEEIPAKGMTCRITESYRDVSADVLSAAKEDMSFAERAKAFEQKIKEIVAAEEAKAKDIRAEVAEMFAGKSYVLFIYRNIKDVRLVYVPPRSIGEFGGETDNWVWPRHTGDFSFMRVYVAQAGATAECSLCGGPLRNGAQDERDDIDGDGTLHERTSLRGTRRTRRPGCYASRVETPASCFVTGPSVCGRAR